MKYRQCRIEDRDTDNCSYFTGCKRRRTIVNRLLYNCGCHWLKYIIVFIEFSFILKINDVTIQHYIVLLMSKGYVEINLGHLKQILL